MKHIEEQPFIPPVTTEPEPLPLSSGGYVYDDKLGYGFEFPDGWEFSINVDKDVEQCDPALSYEKYNCVDSPDKSIKKVITFYKKQPLHMSTSPPQIDFMVKSATDLQEIKNDFKKEMEMAGAPILNEAEISVNNISGYDMLGGTLYWKERQAVFFVNGVSYIFKYSSLEEFYHMSEETFNNTINSFNIK